MRRRDFIKILAGSAASWPLTTRAQQTALPMVAFINGGNPEVSARRAASFRTGLSEVGYVDGRNVVLEYHWLEGHYDRLPALMADLVHRGVAVIATPGSTPASLAAKAATTTMPIAFGAAEDPVHLGLVSSLAWPGGNATGINFFVNELIAKRLRLLHDLIPTAAHIAVLVNPTNAPTAEATIRDIEKAAPAMGLQYQVLNAATAGEINTAFAGFERERPDALFIAPDGFFSSRAVQFATLTARDRIPATYSDRDSVALGGLMSYGTDLAEMFRQVGVYTGRILKGEKPAEMPVTQLAKFEFAINLQTAQELGIKVPSGLLSIADEVIE